MNSELESERAKNVQANSDLVKKNAEYQAMLADIEATRTRISELETREIELYDEQENAGKALTGAEKDYSAAERAVKAELADFDTLISEIKEEVLKLKRDKKRFTVRKMSDNIGVERIFPLESPFIESIVVNKVGRVRRAKLYYLRALTGKKARIKEKRV